ncbi:unnamed protein product [Phytophthora fragariaefolia]|uniref:Unnamed protein product n=1 Tax=Phytophthora fragariaefolia TaxID=1490495 RepID=A0A9W7DAN1_9STRA|nr:unnamed protein product [Phytophthora fragariaefolia]
MIVEENGLQGLIGKTDPSMYGYRDRMKPRCRLLVEFNLRCSRSRSSAWFSWYAAIARRTVSPCSTSSLVMPRHRSASTALPRRVEALGAPSISPQPDLPVRQGRSSVYQLQSPLKALGVEAKPSGERYKPVSKPSRQATPPVDACLVCHGPHWMRECPTATAAQREESLARYRASKDQRGNVVRSKVVKARESANT